MIHFGKFLTSKISYFKFSQVVEPEQPTESIEYEFIFEDYGLTNAKPMFSYATIYGGFV